MRAAALLCLVATAAATSCAAASEASEAGGRKKPAGEQVHEWPQYKGGPGFHGWSPDESVKPPFKLLWDFRTDGDGSGDAGGGVVVADNKVFLGVWMNSTILCIDARDGKFLWSSKRLAGYGGRSVPGYYKGRVYVWITRSDRMKVIALDAQTGETAWETPLKGGSTLGGTRTGLAIAEDKVFCVDHGEDPAVRALDAATGEQVWRTSLGKGYGTSAIQPCYAGGRVFAGVTNRNRKKLSGATVALDAKTGKELWRRDKVFPNTTPSTDGKIVAVCMDTLEDSHTYGLDCETGKTVVKVEQPGFSRRTPTITPKLILSKYYGNNFSTADRETGKVLWRFHPLNTGCNTPTVSGNYCYFGCGRPQGFKGSPLDSGGKGFCNGYKTARDAGYGWTLYALDLATGKPVWQHASAFNVCGETAIAYGRLYQVSGGGHIYCYAPAKDGEPTTPEARDGSPAAPAEEVRRVLARKAAFGEGWPMAGGGPERNGREGVTLKDALAPAWKLETGGRVQAEPAIVDGKVYIGSNSGSFYAIDGATGRPLWEKKTGSRMRCAPAVADGAVYVGSDGGAFYALDAAGGAEKWKFECGGPVRGAPAVVGGAVIFGANDHNIYALDRETGRKLWNFRTRYYRHHAAPVVHGDTVYALPGIDYVHAIDIVTGKEKWNTFCVKTGEGLSYYKDRLWAHGWCAAEIDATRGGVTRFMYAPQYGYNRITCMNDRIYVAGTGGGQCLDFTDPGREEELPVLVKGDHKAGRMPSKGKSVRFRSANQASSPAASPVPLGDRLVFTAVDGQVTLSQPDGSVIWTGELGASTHASPGVGCGMLVIGDDKGAVHCFREK